MGENSRKLIRVLLYLYSIALCVIGLFVEFYQVFYHRMKTERDILRHMIAIEAEKYKKEKATIDAINSQRSLRLRPERHHLHPDILNRAQGKFALGSVCFFISLLLRAETGFP